MKPEITINSLSGTTFHVRVTRQFRVRMAVGLWLMRLAARVMGAKCEVSREES